MWGTDHENGDDDEEESDDQPAIYVARRDGNRVALFTHPPVSMLQDAFAMLPSRAPFAGAQSLLYG